jgi:hypothetical protein
MWALAPGARNDLSFTPSSQNVSDSLLTAPDSQPVPAIVSKLAWAGMLPFAFGALGLWLAPVDQVVSIARVTMLYGVIIASFMGAVPFGFAVADVSQDRPPNTPILSLSVLPALAAWFAALPSVFVALAGCFVGIYTLDVYAAKIGLAPTWYVRMRRPLTITIVALLVVSTAAILVRLTPTL